MPNYHDLWSTKDSKVALSSSIGHGRATEHLANIEGSINAFWYVKMSVKKRRLDSEPSRDVHKSALI